MAVGLFKRKRRPHPGDVQVIHQLAAAGSDLSKVHVIEHFLYFPDESAARSVADGLTPEGYETDAYPGASDPSVWVVLANFRSAVSIETISAQRAMLTELAEEADVNTTGGTRRSSPAEQPYARTSSIRPASSSSLVSPYTTQRILPPGSTT